MLLEETAVRLSRDYWTYQLPRRNPEAVIAKGLRNNYYCYAEAIRCRPHLLVDMHPGTQVRIEVFKTLMGTYYVHV